MSELGARLGGGLPLLLDGGLGSMLIAAGLRAGEPPERWTLERPAEVVAVHRAYVQAGSEAVHTNTFGANAIRLGRAGLAQRGHEINRRAVELARQAGARFVLGDVGPSGEYLPPVGKADEGRWREAFFAQGQALAGAGVDGLHVETMSDLREAVAALESLREAAPELPVMVSLTYERRRRGFFTVMGDSPARAAAELGTRGAAAVGANCSITSAEMRALGPELVAALDARGRLLAVVAQPNAGQPLVSSAGVSYAQSPDAFADDMVALIQAGVRIAGGCCGTDPSFIAALRARLGPQGQAP
ncbi:MAG: homocysteine S-methyltransferase family protein [Deltaproteobacteria bacterium]|nr:homocysteine S-methyltransferase family protein [Deltaproteobacteria bacterium]